MAKMRTCPPCPNRFNIGRQNNADTQREAEKKQMHINTPPTDGERQDKTQ